jgi:hypothetical protein
MLDGQPSPTLSGDDFRSRHGIGTKGSRLLERRAGTATNSEVFAVWKSVPLALPVLNFLERMIL